MYFSYSSVAKRSVAFLKFADGQPVRIQIDAQHPPASFLKFTLGGNDEGRYKPFNGQFLRVFYNDQPGTFLDTVDQVTQFVASQGDRPSNQWDKQINIPVVGPTTNIVYNDNNPKQA
jgi:hypothetical protein